MIRNTKFLFQLPTTSDEWIKIPTEFGVTHKFWNCVSAIYDKHIAIKKLVNSGFVYYDYKGFYSIVCWQL